MSKFEYSKKRRVVRMTTPNECNAEGDAVPLIWLAAAPNRDFPVILIKHDGYL